MCSKLSENAILQGYIDHYCLPCELLLRSDDEAERHCEKMLHENNLGKCHYVDGYSDHRIRKVKQGYFCEFCNIYLTTLTKIKLHVTDASHEFNKTDEVTAPVRNMFLKRHNKAIIAFEDVLINDESWNGLSGDTCLVCDVECDDVNTHETESGHVLKLMTSNIQFGGDNSISRRFDNQTSQCVTCNVLVPSNSLTTHFDSQEHKKNYLQCRKARRNILQENGEEKANINENKENKPDNKQMINEKEKTTENAQKITDKTKQYVTEDINEVLAIYDYIYKDGDKATCLLCMIDMIPWEWEFQKHLRSEHHKILLKLQKKRDARFQPKGNTENPEKLDTEKQKADSNCFVPNENEAEVTGAISKNVPKPEESFREYAQRNGIDYNRRGNGKAEYSVYCRVCNTDVPPSKECLEQHINGKTHKKLSGHKQDAANKHNTTKAETSRNTQEYRTIRMEEFSDYKEIMFVGVGQLDPIAIINKEILVTSTSLVMLADLELRENMRLRCEICDRSITVLRFRNHLDSAAHMKAFNKVPVVVSLQDEFVRELRPGKFHCGYCNTFVSTFPAMLAHLKLSAHQRRKAEAKRELERHLPAIVEYEREQMVEQFVGAILDRTLS